MNSPIWWHSSTSPWHHSPDQGCWSHWCWCHNTSRTQVQRDFSPNPGDQSKIYVQVKIQMFQSAFLQEQVKKDNPHPRLGKWLIFTAMLFEDEQLIWFITPIGVAFKSFTNAPNYALYRDCGQNQSVASFSSCCTHLEGHGLVALTADCCIKLYAHVWVVTQYHGLREGALEPPSVGDVVHHWQSSHEQPVCYRLLVAWVQPASQNKHVSALRLGPLCSGWAMG